MKIFIAGATGVVGRRVVPLLLEGGYQVTAVARTAKQVAALRALGARAAAHDLFNVESLHRAVAGHNVVVNLATHIPPSSARMMLPWAWRENDRLRRVASSNLADAAIAAGAERFIQESFAPAYPGRGDAWIEEDTPLSPTRYNRTLLDAERSAQRFTRSGATGVVLRFALFYGPDAFQLDDMIRFVRRGWAPLPGTADAYVSSVSHDDAANAVFAALQLPTGAYNVVDDEPLTRRAYFDSLAQALGVAPPALQPAWMARLFGSMGELLARSQRISNRRLRTATGWTPVYPSVRHGWQSLISAPSMRTTT